MALTQFDSRVRAERRMTPCSFTASLGAVTVYQDGVTEAKPNRGVERRC